jgi:beta-N-acetylhexosaminidase
LIVARFRGSSPPGGFLARVRAGQIGAVILFSENGTGDPAAVRSTVGRLQSAAAAGSNPPLLIMADQEGGAVKRMRWAPPRLAPAAMDSPALARAEGALTGRALRSAGVNVDLAPVADVERVPRSFLGSRAFGATSSATGTRACAFASGLEAAGVAFTLKHFPGLGRAGASTDVRPVTIAAPAKAIRGDYAAYRHCGSARSALVMISSAAYPTLTGGAVPAVMAPEIYRRELPLASRAEPVTISDDLQASALTGQRSPAARAVDSGLDMLLYAETERGSAEAFEKLRGELRQGIVSRAAVERAASAVGDLKALVARAAPTAARAEPGSTGP